MEPLPADMIEQGRREALNAVRRTMANQGLPMAAADNLLGFPPDAQGQVPALAIRKLERDECDVRLNQCAAFCRFWTAKVGSSKPSITSRITNR